MATPPNEPDGDLEVVPSLDGQLVSYAQNAEDVVLARALRPDERLGTWIDVGAGHPCVDSVTAAFSVRGWRGINIEPRPEMHRLLEHARPRDLNLCVALGARPGSATLWIPEREPSLSTTSTIGRERMVRAGDQLVETPVAVTTLAAVCEEHVKGEIDFLKIDVEGSERDVLVGADWDRWRPRILAIEAVVPESTERRDDELDDVLRVAEYEQVLFDGLNAFYVRREDSSLADSLRVAANLQDRFVTATFLHKVRDLRRAVAYNSSVTDELREARRRIAELEGHTTDLEHRLASVERARDEAVNELHALRATKTFRATAWIRRVLSRPRKD